MAGFARVVFHHTLTKHNDKTNQTIELNMVLVKFTWAQYTHPQVGFTHLMVPWLLLLPVSSGGGADRTLPLSGDTTALGPPAPEILLPEDATPT